MQHTVPAQPDATRAAITSGLRELADWLDAHPDIPVRTGSECEIEHSILADDDTAGLAELDRITAAVGIDAAPSRVGDCSHPQVSVEFGPVRWMSTYVPRASMAAYNALQSYNGAVQPDGAR
jgi:hypothetical protein